LQRSLFQDLQEMILERLYDRTDTYQQSVLDASTTQRLAFIQALQPSTSLLVDQLFRDSTVTERAETPLFALEAIGLLCGMTAAVNILFNIVARSFETTASSLSLAFFFFLSRSYRLHHGTEVIRYVC
jgi:hypothetical protein